MAKFSDVRAGERFDFPLQTVWGAARGVCRKLDEHTFQALAEPSPRRVVHPNVLVRRLPAGAPDSLARA